MIRPSFADALASGVFSLKHKPGWGNAELRKQGERFALGGGPKEYLEQQWNAGAYDWAIN